MKIEFQGKTIHISDEEISKSMALLGISQTEAIQLWLEDNDYCENAEAAALTKKAKENKAVQHGAVNPDKPKSPVKRERKPDEEKENIIRILSDFLAQNGYENVEVVNKSKLIHFTIGDNIYKLDLVRQRAPKNK